MTPSRLTAQEARTPDDRILSGLEEILKSGVSGDLRAIARREYLDRTNPPETRKELAA